MKKLILLTITTFVATFAITSFGFGQRYEPIPTTHAGAGLAADFAVKERAKRTNTKLKLDELAGAEAREGGKLGSSTFRVCLRVSSGKRSSSAQAVVSMDQYSNLSLVSWTNKNCGGSPGGFEQVENTHAGIGLAADFAIKKHSEDTKVKHTLVSILKAEIRGMFEPEYRVCMKVAEGKETQVIQTVVKMDQYSNMKLISWQHSECGTK